MRQCAILTLVVFLGCGGSDSGPPTVNDVCGPQGIYVDYFDRLIECNPLYSLVIGSGLSDEDIAAACDAQLRPFVDDGSVVVGDGSAFATCQDYLQNATCEELNDRHPVDPCGGIFEGTVAAGGPCENDEQCAGDAYCDQPTPPSCGTCTARLPDTSSCFSDEECASRRCASGTCQQFVGLDGSCQNTADCLSPYVCDASMHCTANPTWSVGSTCDSSQIISQCGFPNLYCSQATNQCTTWREVGQSCSTMLSAGMLCRLFEYQTCQDIGGGTFQCQAATIVNAGEECGVATGRKCADGSRVRRS